MDEQVVYAQEQVHVDASLEVVVSVLDGADEPVLGAAASLALRLVGDDADVGTITLSWNGVLRRSSTWALQWHRPGNAGVLSSFDGSLVAIPWHQGSALAVAGEVALRQPPRRGRTSREHEVVLRALVGILRNLAEDRPH